MDEEISIIDSKNRDEKIRNFLNQNKKKIIFLLFTLIIMVISFYAYKIYEDKKRKLLSIQYNSAVIAYDKDGSVNIIPSLKKIIEEKDSTYSPLALYFIIDKKLIESQNDVNKLFDILIKETSLEAEIKNLIIYKKALYNADYKNENEFLDMIKPLINSESVWKSHALYLAAEFFYSKNEKQKSKEFFNQIMNLTNANQDILIQAQKRLNRDLSE